MYLLSALFLVALILGPVSSFATPRARVQLKNRRDFSVLSLRVAKDSGLDSAETVDRLLNAVELTKNDNQSETEASDTKNTIKELMSELEQNYAESNREKSDDPSRFEPLLGLYDVSYILTTREKDNPVGGKWTRKNGVAQKILRTRRTFQHLLAPNTTGLGAMPVTNNNTDASQSQSLVVAEAVNIVSLEALWGLIRLTIILRGDAVPLTTEERKSNKLPVSTLVVRAFFDPPRIVFGKLGRLINLCLGPKSSVVLDSTYVDDKIRIGVGGTSGTRFLFSRCDDDETEEANEWRALLSRSPMRKSRALGVLAAFTGIGLYGALNQGVKVLGFGITALASLLGLGLAFSSGGIERGATSRT